LLDVTGSPITAASDTSYDPALYIGKDGKLLANLWTGSSASPMESSAVVNNGAWHYALLVGDAGNSEQYLYIDGQQVDSESAAISLTPGYVTVGAGWMGGNWPDDSLTGTTTATVQRFTGSISDVSIWRNAVDAQTANSLYTAAKDSTGIVPVESVTV